MKINLSCHLSRHDFPSLSWALRAFDKKSTFSLRKRGGSKNKHNAMSQKFSRPHNSKLTRQQQSPLSLADTKSSPGSCEKQRNQKGSPHELASTQCMSAQLAHPGSAIVPIFHLPESKHVSPQIQPDAISDSGPAWSGLAVPRRDSQCHQTSLAGPCWAGFPR